MALYDDFKKFREEFKTLSPTLKVWMCFSALLATGPIADMSTFIFKWRNFIKDGVDYYRENITGNFIRFFETVDLAVPEWNINLIIISIIFSAGGIRVNCSSLMLVLFPLVVFLVLMLILAAPFSYIFDYVINSMDVSLHPSVIEAKINTYFGALKFMLLLGIGGLPFIIILLMLMVAKVGNIAERIKFFTPIVLAICIILILGAFNSAIQQIHAL